LELFFAIEFGHSCSQPGGEFVGALPGPIGVHTGLASRGDLLVELDGAVVPMVDLAGEPVVHGRPHLVDARHRAGTDLREVRRNRFADGGVQCGGCQIALQPVSVKDIIDELPFIIADGPIVEVGRGARRGG
jgi:hypothetical protein